jgi:hypothetical protein
VTAAVPLPPTDADDTYDTAEEPAAPAPAPVTSAAAHIIHHHHH